MRCFADDGRSIRQSMATIRCSLPSLSSAAVDKACLSRYTHLMRVVQLRLLLAIILVLSGATVIVGLNLGSDADALSLQSRTQTLRANPEEQTLTSASLPSSVLHSSRTDSKIAPRSCASVIDLVCILRC